MSENKAREDAFDKFLFSIGIEKAELETDREAFVIGRTTFNAGYDSRDPEVAGLKAEIKRLNERIDRDAEKLERYGE